MSCTEAPLPQKPQLSIQCQLRGGTSTSRREAMYLCTYATHGEAWGGLLKHNNKDHRNRSGFVDLSKNSKDSGYKARLKLKHAYWFSSRKVVVEGVPQTVREKGKQLDHNGLQEVENGQDVSCKKRKVSSAF